MNLSARFFSLIAVALLGTLCIGRTLSAQDQEGSPAKDHEILRIRHAQACLELAESRLEHRLDINNRRPGFYTEKELRRYRQDVAVAKRHLATIRSGDAVQVHLQHARELADVAKVDYQDALEVSAEKPGAMTKHQMNELRLKAEIAELRLAIWSHPEANVLSLMDHLHWQLERLSEEVLELQRRLDKVELN